LAGEVVLQNSAEKRNHKESPLDDGGPGGFIIWLP
jgi:hypothetical protein